MLEKFLLFLTSQMCPLKSVAMGPSQPVPFMSCFQLEWEAGGALTLSPWWAMPPCPWRGDAAGLPAGKPLMLVGKGGAGAALKPCEYADFIWQLNLDAYPLAPLEMRWLSLCLEAISCAEWVSLVDASGCEQWGSDNMCQAWKHLRLWWWLATLVF